MQGGRRRLPLLPLKEKEMLGLEDRRDVLCPFAFLLFKSCSRLLPPVFVRVPVYIYDVISAAKKKQKSIKRNALRPTYCTYSDT